MSRPEVLQITVPAAVLHQQLGEDTVLLHVANEHYYGLDEVGSRFWQLLRQHQTLDPIVAILLDEYEVDETTLRNDLERLVDELADTGLIQVERA